MAAQLSGEISTILGALDQGMFDEGGLALLGLAGPTFDDEHYPDDEMYRTFGPQGISVLFEGRPGAQKASAVFVYMTAHGGAHAYPTPDQLIDGLSLSTADRETVVTFMGEPAHSGGAFDIYAVDARFLHFEFDGDTLTTITAMSEVPGL